MSCVLKRELEPALTIVRWVDEWDIDNRDTYSARGDTKSNWRRKNERESDQR